MDTVQSILTALPIPDTNETTVVVIPPDPTLLQAQKKKMYRQARVAAYCRVSTDDKEQLSSYESQKTFYTDKILANPDWSLQGIYADEGITGTSTKRREQFNEMIKACKQRKIDIIITKSISRFARNTVDSLQYVRALRALDIAVIFEKEGINTLEMSDEIILTVLSMMAQAESESQSKNVSMGIHMGYKAGKVPFRCHLLGYTKDKLGNTFIITEQADIVRTIFKNYLKGDSLENIADYLEENEIPSPKGSSRWSVSTILSMLMNEKYVGDAILQKTFIKDCLSKKVVKNNGILPKYLIQNHHAPIIDRLTFNRVQQEIARRKGKRKVSEATITEQGKYSSKYALTELLICGECNTPYRRITWARNGMKKVVWRCINRLDHGTKYCKNSPSIEESALQQAIVRAINENIMNINEMAELAAKHLSAAMQGDEILNRIALQNRIKELKDVRSNLIKLSAKPSADQEKYEEEFKQISDEMKSITEMLEAEEQRQAVSESFNAQMDDIMQLTQNGKFYLTEYSDKYVRLMIECVKVNSPEEITVIFKGGTSVEVQLN